MRWDDAPRYQPQEPEDASVLVAIVPSVADWETIRREGWYRIPVERAPQRMAYDYIAFYHPRAFHDWRWSIRSYARIERYELRTRAELLPDQRDHPRADRLYYRLSLGPLQMLPKPIPSLGLRRISFIPTTLARLLRAEDVADLWLRRPPTAAKETAYRLRERTAGRRLREFRLAYG